MPPEAVPSNASVASTGLGIRYIGEHCYAFSGDVVVAQAGMTPVLEFTSGSGYILGSLQIGSTSGSGVNTDMHIYFNDVMVMQGEFGSTGPTYPTASIPWDFLIPPNTKCSFNLSSQSGDLIFQSIFIGRVYGAT